jgi:hypothetical protein
MRSQSLDGRTQQVGIAELTSLVVNSLGSSLSTSSTPKRLLSLPMTTLTADLMRCRIKMSSERWKRLVHQIIGHDWLAGLQRIAGRRSHIGRKPRDADHVGVPATPARISNVAGSTNSSTLARFTLRPNAANSAALVSSSSKFWDFNASKPKLAMEAFCWCSTAMMSCASSDHRLTHCSTGRAFKMVTKQKT